MELLEYQRQNLISESLMKSLLENLQEHICVVSFTKINGEFRKMRCTLREDILPKVEVKENAKPRKVNESVLSVWDVDKNDWRAFRLDSVTSVTVDHDPTVEDIVA
jgi:hypothetical protein